MFLTPFVAQRNLVSEWLGQKGADKWVSATIHSQQGAEADVVIFDTVNAASTGWLPHEWERLINVGISRARELLIVVAGREEMKQPFLCSLAQNLKPRCLHRTRLEWLEVPPNDESEETETAKTEGTIGYQIAERRRMRPVLTEEQQKLCRRELSGLPQLVRGVPGSGKTIILCHWVVSWLKRLHEEGDFESRLLVVFGNRTLEHLLRGMIREMWGPTGQSGVWQQIRLRHIRDLLRDLGAQIEDGDFEYERHAEGLMAGGGIEPICRALFVDEAQDMGHATLELLGRLTEHVDPENPQPCSIHIFL
jgi:hypothetical protein